MEDLPELLEAAVWVPWEDWPEPPDRVVTQVLLARQEMAVTAVSAEQLVPREPVALVEPMATTAQQELVEPVDSRAQPVLVERVWEQEPMGPTVCPVPVVTAEPVAILEPLQKVLVLLVRQAV
jgi:hypothetical protein